MTFHLSPILTTDDQMEEFRGSTSAPSIPIRHTSLIPTSPSTSSIGSTKTAETSLSYNKEEEEDVEDDIVYVLKQHTFTTLVPMSVETDIVSFEDLPEEAQREPTKIMTWARQTPENLYLETILPPSCPVCLDALEKRVAATKLELPPPIGTIPKTVPTDVTNAINAHFQQHEKQVSVQQRVSHGLAM